MKKSTHTDRGPDGRMQAPRLIIAALLLMAVSSCGLAQKPPVLNVPTPDCGGPTLTTDVADFRIENVAPSYAGKTAKVTSSNCNSTTYTLSAAQSTTLKALAPGDLSTNGITIVFQTDASGAALLVKGELNGDEIGTVDTPTPGGTQVQAEISLLKTRASADGKSVDVRVLILNTGASGFELTANDVSLAASDGSRSGPLSSKPGLPQTFKPNAKREITFTLARPASASAPQYDIRRGVRYRRVLMLEA